MDLNVDPNDFDAVRRVMADDTSFKIYKKTWCEFVDMAKITQEKPPVETDFSNFFDAKRKGGMAGSSLTCLYSHLNKFMTQLYNRQLKVSFCYAARRF